MFFSKEFIKIVERIRDSKLESEVAFFFDELIKGTDYGNDFDINFISCEEDSNDMVSFIPEKKLTKFYIDSGVEETYKEFLARIKEDANFWNEQKKTKIKIGRLINKLSQQINIEFEDIELEDFINAFKGFNALNRGNSKFEIIRGEEIKKYYLYTNYQNMKGQLGESCMRYKRCQEYFSIYTQNPDICSLLILRGEGKKIIGRAIVWQTEQGHLYLDRVYSNNDSDNVLFNAYARDTLGCTYSYDEIFSFKFKKYLELSIRPKNIKFDKYPYMDTFRFYYTQNGSLYSVPIVTDEDAVEMILTTGNYFIEE
jgi:hypothetical protein